MRDHLKGWLNEVKRGETVLVTERGKPVARLSSPEDRGILDELIARGEATPAKRRKSPASTKRRYPLRGEGPGAVELVKEQRR